MRCGSRSLKLAVRIPLPRTRVHKGKRKGRSVLAPALPLGIRLWLLPAAQQALGLLGPLGVLLLGLAEELDQFVVAFLLRVFDVLGVHLTALGGVVEDAGEVVDGIAYAGSGLLTGSH